MHFGDDICLYKCTETVCISDSGLIIYGCLCTCSPVSPVFIKILCASTDNKYYQLMIIITINISDNIT